MSFITVAVAATAIGGAIKAIDGNKKANAAKKKAEDAQNELEKQKDMFAGLDTSNPYLNMENVQEDLTVNQKEAQFKKQQQSQANVLNTMRSAAGSSGIAALAQTLANQGSLDAQKSAASIGTQEAANQQKMADEASKIQGLEREGELISRQAESSKISSLMGMSADELANQRDAQAAGQAQMWAGIGDVAGAGFQAVGAKQDQARIEAGLGRNDPADD